jgi:hypothetical protein
MERMLEMVESPFPPPGGYPAVGEQAILDRIAADAADADRQLECLGVIAPKRATRKRDEDDGGDFPYFDPAVDY